MHGTKQGRFPRDLDQILEDVGNSGNTFAVVKAGDLHRRVGGYPGRDHRMPTCCDVMEKHERIRQGAAKYIGEVRRVVSGTSQPISA